MTAHFRHMLSSSDSSVTLPYSALISFFPELVNIIVAAVEAVNNSRNN